MKSIKKKINDLTWEIAIASTLSPELVDNMKDGEACLGATWSVQQKIFVSSELNEFSARNIIAHELTHAFLYTTQMNVPESFTEEDVCNFMARWGKQIVDLTEEIYNELFNS